MLGSSGSEDAEAPAPVFEEAENAPPSAAAGVLPEMEGERAVFADTQARGSVVTTGRVWLAPMQLPDEVVVR